VRARTGRAFPDDPWEQLWGAVGAVFGSWENPRAVAYRQLNEIPGDWGTAVSVCAMVFGNMGPGSGTGVAFTRDPSTGERVFYGEYLEDAQGEDVVAGIRTPEPIARLAERMPKAWKELSRVQARLEKHFRDMQDLEFTVEDGRLYLLQCRAGKRTAFAAVRIAVDMVAERLIDREEALARIPPASLEQLLRPVFDPRELERARRAGALFARGLNAGPGAAAGVAVFGAEEAERRAALGETVILVRLETSPEDIRGMQAAAGILTARGGMTSHAALVARQMGKVCVAGAGALEIDARARRLAVGAKQLRDGEWLSLDGSTGEVYAGRIATRPSPVLEALAGTDAGARRTPLFRAYERVMRWADEVRTLSVRANADQGDQCAQAVAFGAEGVGLCRTEHMFFGAGKIGPVREFILAANAEERQRALAKLLPLQRADFEAIFTAMGERPVTIRTLDPPLHEFLPSEPAAVAEVAASLGISPSAVRAKVEALHELNPMLGHRGCRLGISYPELTRMQARALFEAACAVAKRTRRKPRPEIMIPLVATRRELELQAAVVRETADAVLREAGVRLVYSIGTMIELPRACMAADSIAEVAEFFSFGTNDLTQTTFGISRDDGAKFLPRYLEQEILAEDPFASLDREGVGALMKLACQRGRMVRERIKLGICGEHGGDPKSIALCQELGLDYVSCSPFRIPIARLAAAQAALAAR
jgi:pyruvate,orthophosphate dikinase